MGDNIAICGTECRRKKSLLGHYIFEVIKGNKIFSKNLETDHKKNQKRLKDEKL
jgi:hypothetical protein